MDDIATCGGDWDDLDYSTGAYSPPPDNDALVGVECVNGEYFFEMEPGVDIDTEVISEPWPYTTFTTGALMCDDMCDGVCDGMQADVKVMVVE